MRPVHLEEEPPFVLRQFPFSTQQATSSLLAALFIERFYDIIGQLEQAQH